MTDLQVSADGDAATPLETPLQLSAALHAAAEFVIVDRAAGPYAQAAVFPDRVWVVEVVEDPASGQGVRADVPNTDAAYDALRSWCNGDGWWAESFTWVPFTF